MTEQEQPTHKDFFISYTGADRIWAEWIAWQLEEAGYSTVFQKSFPGGQNFVEEMKTALEETSNTLAVLSPDYIDALSTSDEWSEVLSFDSSDKQRVLIPIQVRETRNRLRSLLPLLSYMNLVGLDEREAREVLLEGIGRVSKEASSSSPQTLITAKQPLFPASFPPIWNVPYSRNPFFIGREDLLIQLAESLQTERNMSSAQPQAISGLGGIGKTQLALEYAYRYCQNYEAVFWVRADSREALVADYTDIARLLTLSQYSEHDQSLTILAVKQWLQRHLNWLLILDNADDLEIVRDFLPSAPSGHIILTTRAFSMRSLAERLNVDTLTLVEGSLLLLRRASLIKPRSMLQEAQPDDVDQASTIVQMLDGYPLALDQAGAYIEETGCSLSDYIKLYQVQRSALLRRRGKSFVPGHPDPVATTWTLAFAKIAQSSPTAAELLQLCAFLAPDDIPEELITSGGPDLSPALKSIVDEPIALNDAIATLLQYSLIRRNSSNKTLSIHRLVQTVLLNDMNENTARKWATRAVRIVSHIFPSGNFETWPQCDRLLPHALRCVDWVDRYELFFPEVIHLLNRTGYYLSERARYREAEALWRRALMVSEQSLGDSHPDTATILNNLAQLYREQGKYEEAEPLYERALAIREQQLGAEHPNTAMSLNNLARLYYLQGKYNAAEPLYHRALAIFELQLGVEHPNTAMSLNNLAQLYHDQGRYEEAEVLYRQALAIREQQLGFEHPGTAMSLNSLAQLYRQQGKYKEAEPLYQRALDIRERQLGAEHPDTAISLSNLARLYQQQYRYAEAEALYKRSLAIFEQQLGPEHPYIAISFSNLADLCQQQGRYEEAESLYQRALAIRLQVLGPEHPDTAISLNNLANLYQQQDRYEEAGPLYLRALAIFDRVVGAEHPYTTMVKQNLASLRQRSDRVGEEEEIGDQPGSSNQDYMESSNM